MQLMRIWEYSWEINWGSNNGKNSQYLIRAEVGHKEEWFGWIHRNLIIWMNTSSILLNSNKV